MAEISVRGVELTDDSIIVSYVEEPRMMDGRPVFTTHTLVVPVDAEPTRPLVDDFKVLIADLARDLLEATGEGSGNTQSLAEWEAEQDEFDDEALADLGMGDTPEDPDA